MTQNRSAPPRRPTAAPPRASVPYSSAGPGRSHTPQLRLHQYVVTQPGDCPYLPGMVEQKLVTALEPGDPESYSRLHAAGFRRSHEMAYRPVCPNCDKCRSLRIDIDAFKPNRTQRKLLNKHQGLKRIVSEHGPTEQSFRLFHDYTRFRHHDGEMSSMGPMDFTSLVLESSVDTHLIEWHDPSLPADESLVAACLTDVLSDGLSMVYSFFDTEVPKASYGTFMILSLMEVCRRLQLPYLYLGYWVEGSANMGYKGDFRASEAFGDTGWEVVKPAS